MRFPHLSFPIFLFLVLAVPVLACDLPYDYPPCDNVNQTELAAAIGLWFGGQLNTSDLMLGINWWKNPTLDSNVSGQQKDNSMYSSKELFMVSASDWKEVLPLVPLAVWTGNESWCQRATQTPGDACVYPVLVYYEESGPFGSGSFDIDSAIYFMQQYNPTKVSLLGDTSQQIIDTITGARPVGAGILLQNIQNITLNNTLDYWGDYSNVVYVEENYELALMASVYASYINAPLVIQGSVLDTASTFSGRTVTCVGSAIPSGGGCTYQYTLQELKQEYLSRTSTDKLLLVNHDDLFINDSELFWPDKSPAFIHELYSRNSLAAPFLASAKHELLISTGQTYYSDVDSFIDGQVSSLSMSPEYLTIVASPNAIDMSYEDASGKLYAADPWFYSQLDSEPFLDLAVGRITGVTVADTSATVARTLFYEQTLDNPDRVLSTRGSPFQKSAANVYAMGKVFTAVGYQTLTTPDGTTSADWENRFFINYEDHGNTGWAGISTTQIPLLDNTFLSALACSTCDYVNASSKNSLFCTNFLRHGGIGMIAATDVSGYVNNQGFIYEVFGNNQSLGKAFLNAKNSNLVHDWDFVDHNTMPWYLLLGDPTLKLVTLHNVPKYSVNMISQGGHFSKYSVSVPSMEVAVPGDVADLCEATCNSSDLFFSGLHHRQLDINKDFEFVLPYEESFPNMSDYWLFTFENTNDGDRIWVKSAYDFDGYFVGGNDAGFTSFTYNFTFYDTAPDIQTNETDMNATFRNISTRISNVGDRLASVVGGVNGKINITGYDNLTALNVYYYYENYTFVGHNFDLDVGDSEIFYTWCPEIDSLNRNFSDGNITMFFIQVDPDLPESFVQKYTDNDIEGVIVRVKEEEKP